VLLIIVDLLEDYIADLTRGNCFPFYLGLVPRWDENMSYFQKAVELLGCFPLPK